MDWSDANVALLKKGWDDGRSAAQIAKTMLTTRNTVLGKLNRLGLLGTRQVAARPARHNVARGGAASLAKALAATSLKPPTSEQIARTLAPADILTPDEARSDNVEGSRPWTERRFGECSFPVSGEGADTHSCCAPTDGNYCREHALRMYVPSPPRRLRLKARVA